MEPMPCDAARLFTPWEPGMFSLLVYVAVACALIGVLLFLTARLGAKTAGPEKLGNYESGMTPVGRAYLLYPVPFYLVAAFFLIFDVEAVFIFSWAAAFRVLGWTGWVRICLFIAVLFVSLVYVWKKGGLDWGPPAQKKP
jgi:NADH-quinone oxidoreductase subunit A